MATLPVNPPADGWSLTVPAPAWRALSRHLFRDDRSGHGAVLLAEVTVGGRGNRLLTREVILARDEVDYGTGEHGHHALAAAFVRDAIARARDNGFAYLAVHNHSDGPSVGFSLIDMASHERGYPALLQINGNLVGGLVLTRQAAAGDLWLPGGARAQLAEMTVPGANLTRLRPRPSRPAGADPARDRHALLFGDVGQEAFRCMRVAVVGLGGVGSIVVECLARLGVGHLVLIDNDIVEVTNLARLVAAELDDIGKPKTEPAARNAHRANPHIDLTPLPHRVQDPRALAELSTCDWIFLAADTHAARHYVNEAVHRYQIPATQVGIKIQINSAGQVGDIHTATRLFLPGEGCMWCNGLIDPTELAIDMLPDPDRRLAQYVPGVPAPSVITLNALAAAEAVNHFMLSVTGLHRVDDTCSVTHLPRERQRVTVMHRQSRNCPWCAGFVELGASHTVRAAHAVG